MNVRLATRVARSVAALAPRGRFSLFEPGLNLRYDRAEHRIDPKILRRIDRRHARRPEPLCVGERDDAADDHGHPLKAGLAKLGHHLFGKRNM